MAKSAKISKRRTEEKDSPVIDALPGDGEEREVETPDNQVEAEAPKALTGEEYTARHIQVLKGLEGVRQRPAMYIGSTAESGLHHLVWEIVDNSIDEAMAGHCTSIVVTLHKDGSVSVLDNGRGVPVEFMETEGMHAAEVIFLTLHAGAKFGSGAYKVSGGLHGVGSSVVNALSERFEVETYRDGKVYALACERGKLVEPLSEKGNAPRKRGTFVRLWPDPQIFDTTEFKHTVIEDRLKELAFLNAGLSITLKDESTGTDDTFKFKGGLREFVQHLTKQRTPLHRPIHFVKVANDVRVEFALQWTDGYKEYILSYANNIFTKDGGTHVIGLRAGLTRAVNSYATKTGLLKNGGVQPSGDDIREGLTAAISVWLEHPQFEGQTKSQLGNSDIKGLVESAVNELLGMWLEEHPTEARKIFAKAEVAARVREAARKARDIIRKQAGLDTSLPGKLADCATRDPESAELFIVEGNSAGGNAKQGRNREFQAILPLRGKFLNVEKSSLNKMLSNNEVRTLISAIGTGIGNDFNIEKLRYHKIILMTDADVDGAHIRTLLLTFFFRHMEHLVELGHLHIAQPPLFCIRKGSQRHYVFTEAEMSRKAQELGGNVEVIRFKGLGEMNPEQLWETTMNPETRTLVRLTVEDLRGAAESFERLMGSEVQPRKVFIHEYARRVKNLDI